MKKTLILLILLSSFAFSEQIMIIKSSGVVSHIVAGKEYCYAVSLGSIITEKVNLFDGHLLPKKFYSWMHSSSFRGVGLRASMHYASFVSSKSAVPGITRRELNYRVYNVSAVGISCTPPEPDCKNGEININGKCYSPCPVSTKITSSMKPCACPNKTKPMTHIVRGSDWYNTCEPTSDPAPKPCADGLVFNFYGKCVSPDAPYFPVKPNNPKNPDNNNSNPNGSGNGNINPNNPDTNNSNPSNPNNPNGSGNGNLLPELETQTSILRTINQNLASSNSDKSIKSTENISNILTASDEYWKNENKRKFNLRTGFDESNTNKLGSKIDTTNELLQKILDKNETKPDNDNNVTGDCGLFSPLIPDDWEDLVCNGKADSDFFASKMMSDSWVNSKKIKLSFTSSTSCYLETFSLDFGNGPVDIISEDTVSVIPFNVIANLFLMLVYFGGAREFLRS